MVDAHYRKHLFIGHSDAIWDIKTHPNHPLIASGSADGTVKIWDSRLQENYSLRQTIWSASNQGVTSITWFQGQIAIAYQNSTVRLVDVETLKTMNEFKSPLSGKECIFLND